MTTVKDVENHLDSMCLDYKISVEDSMIRVKLLSYGQTVAIKKTNSLEYMKKTIDSVFEDADPDINQLCPNCNLVCEIWQKCHICNKEVCIKCYIEQRLLNQGADICQLCLAVSHDVVMTSDGLTEWLATTYGELNQLIEFHTTK